MRYIIYGAGGVGGVMGARLFQAGREVVLICRGAHLDAIQRDGLHLLTPIDDVRLPISAVSHPREIAFSDDDVVILTMKTQDTERALLDLETAAGTEIPVVSCQNGVENERLAARRFARVYGMLAWLPATFLDAGTVVSPGTSVTAVLHVGRYPRGMDATAERIAADISASQMLSRPVEQIMPLKYAKLLTNLGNAMSAITGDQGGGDDVRRFNQRMREEGRACLAAAGIEYTPDDEFRETVTAHMRTGEIPGQMRGGSSTWQSLMRGTSTVEVDFLNGEIVMLGNVCGIPTPANAVARRVVARMAAAGERPGRYGMADLEAMLEAESVAV